MKKNKLGIFITCYDEKEAIKYAVNSLRAFYPDSMICVTHESNEDFNFLLEQTSNIHITQGEDTMGAVLGLKPGDHRTEHQQRSIKRASMALLERLDNAIPILNSEYIILHCPDTLIRGPLNIPNGTGLLGSTVNKYFFDEVNHILVKYGGIEIDSFGAVPAIFNVEDYVRAREVFDLHPYMIDELCRSFYAIFSHDILLPILFSLIRQRETFNPDIVECERDPEWESKVIEHPLVHQHRRYYPHRTAKYKVNEA